MMKTFKTRRQPPYKGGRQPAHSAFIPDLEKAVQQEMRTWGVTRSFVIATCVAFALKVEEQPNYKFTAKDLKTGTLLTPAWVKVKK